MLELKYTESAKPNIQSLQRLRLGPKGATCNSQYWDSGALGDVSCGRADRLGALGAQVPRKFQRLSCAACASFTGLLLTSEQLLKQLCPKLLGLPARNSDRRVKGLTATRGALTHGGLLHQARS